MSAAAPTGAQLETMRALVARGMDDGALGLSTGLYYAPGSYASTEEVIELARVAGAKGGLYDSHLRDESSYTIGLIGAVNEAIRIGPRQSFRFTSRTSKRSAPTCGGRATASSR